MRLWREKIYYKSLLRDVTHGLSYRRLAQNLSYFLTSLMKLIDNYFKNPCSKLNVCTSIVNVRVLRVIHINRSFTRILVIFSSNVIYAFSDVVCLHYYHKKLTPCSVFSSQPCNDEVNILEFSHCWFK